VHRAISFSAVLVLSLSIAGCLGAGDESTLDPDTPPNVDPVTDDAAQEVGTAVVTGKQFNFKEPHHPWIDLVDDTIAGLDTVLGNFDSTFQVWVNWESGPIDHVAAATFTSKKTWHTIGLDASFNKLQMHNWITMVDSARPTHALAFWPNPGHPGWTPANDMGGCTTPPDVIIDCWTHKNVRNFYHPTYPVQIRNHSRATYYIGLDTNPAAGKCRMVERWCDYRIEVAAGPHAEKIVRPMGCSGDTLPVFWTDCETRY
jgi:hypothetical protein